MVKQLISESIFKKAMQNETTNENNLKLINVISYNSGINMEK